MFDFAGPCSSLISVMRMHQSSRSGLPLDLLLLLLLFCYCKCVGEKKSHVTSCLIHSLYDPNQSSYFTYERSDLEQIGFLPTRS